VQGIEAVAIFVAVILVWRAIYVNRGNIRFWQLAADQPNAAFEWMQSRSDWIVLRPEDPEVEKLKERADFVDPFKLVVLSVGGVVTIFPVEPVLHCTQHEKDSTLWSWVCVVIRENGRMPLK